MLKKENSYDSRNGKEIPMEKLIIGGAVYTTRLTSKFRNRRSWVRPDIRRVEAVIPGAILNIMVGEGDEVKHGTPLLILVAMKMENQVLSPMDGIIKKIHVSTGDQVAKSQLLLEFI